MFTQFSKVAAVGLSALLCCAGARAESKCHEVAGGITTNFVDSSDTLGSATGDLAGASASMSSTRSKARAERSCSPCTTIG